MKRKLILDKYKCVSFDLFDTLVNRDVLKPKDVFMICEREFLRKYGEVGIPEYAKLRAHCEQNVRLRQDREITYDQIFQEMGKYSDDETIRKYKELELQVEIDFSTPNMEGKKIYEQIVLLGKRIIITTDMYLPRTVIERILNKNGYLEYSEIYLSSELGLTKESGNIFRFILEKEKISSDELLHIGDNLKSDIINAHIKKIHTFYIKKQTYSKVKKDSFESIDSKLICNVLTSFYNNRKDIIKIEECERIGYTCLGPLLYGFLDWLDLNCAKNEIEHILFFSRDGYLMKRIYERMERKSIARFSYFYASRRALQVAAISLDPTYEIVIRAMNFPKRVKVSWLLSNWGLDATLYLMQIESLQLLLESEFDREELLTNEKLKELFNLLKQDIIINSKRECQAFLKYLKETSCHGRIAIVDIGWNGNMQKAFERIVRHFHLDISVQGYYLGVVPTASNQNDYYMQGYLFQKGKNEKMFLKERYINCILEMFLVAPHGSLRRYHVNEMGHAEIEQEEFEYQNSALYSKIKTLQDAAETFVLDYSKVAVHIGNNEIAYSKNLMKHFLFPTFRLIEYWGRFQVWDGEWVSLIKCEKMKYRWRYLLHPHSFLEDFFKSAWKIGFLKQIFVMRLPYVDMLILLRKKYEGKMRGNSYN